MTLQWLALIFILAKMTLYVVWQPAQPPVDVFVDVIFWFVAFMSMVGDKERYESVVNANEMLLNENATLEIYRQEHYEMSEAISWLMRRLQWVSELRK